MPRNGLARYTSYSIDAAHVSTAQALIDEALKSDLAYEIVESLTTEVGPRLGGSEAEQRAREWGATGAIDDGAGVAITVAAAKLVASLPKRPRRTIRVVMFGAEEVGLLGAEAYAKAHAEEVKDHVLATESDFGAGTIWQFESNVNKQTNQAIDAIGKIISQLGIVRGRNDAKGGGPDIIPLDKLGVPTVRLNQNGMDYFDLHHTPDDTLDKIVPEELAQNVAAYAALIYLAAELDVDFRNDTSGSKEE